ncbi:ABC transporter permease [Clostridium sp. KNHs214]|uniref:ABC transporter permease n=1 Tax=Clostridium sp. KNHs214 TaxID=1540257 RepID=UPI00054E0CFE|nr:ABC transporter permease [Clostridium sp. KNHs214]
MLNYIKAELYRNFNRLYFWVYTGGVAIIALALNIIMGVKEGYNFINFTELLSIVPHLFSLPVFLAVGIIDIVISEENKNNTLKNIVCFGVSRNKVVLSKIIVSIILCFLSWSIILITFLGSGLALFGVGANFSISLLGEVIKKLFIAMPLWIGVITIGNFMGLTCKSSNMLGFSYAMIFLFLKRIISILSQVVWDKFKYVYDFLITIQLNNFAKPSLTSEDIRWAILVGIGYTLVFTALSLVYLKNKEIS